MSAVIEVMNVLGGSQKLSFLGKNTWKCGAHTGDFEDVVCESCAELSRSSLAPLGIAISEFGPAKIWLPLSFRGGVAKIKRGRRWVPITYWSFMDFVVNDNAKR